MTAWLTPICVPRLVTAIATRGRAATAATRLRRFVQVTQKRSSVATKFMITPTGSPSFVVHMKQHSVWASSNARSRSFDSVNIETSS